MSHLYSCRERESAAALRHTPLDLFRWVRACRCEPQPRRARNEPPPPNNALRSLYCCLLAAERVFHSKRGKNIKRSRNGCMDFGLAKTSVKMAFRSLCRGRIPLLTSSKVCHLAFVPRISAFLSTHLCFISAETIKQRKLFVALRHLCDFNIFPVSCWVFYGCT